MILLSPHEDKIKRDYSFDLIKGVHSGLLDNEIGKLVTYLACYYNESMMSLCKSGELRVWHNKTEEFGLLTPPKIKKSDTVIVIDICSGSQYKGFDFALENIYGDFKKTIENLKWEGLKFKVKKYTGEDMDEDEAFQWVKLKQKVLSFIIPIEGESWHRNCTIEMGKVMKAVEGLTRLICYES